MISQRRSSSYVLAILLASVIFTSFLQNGVSQSTYSFSSLDGVFIFFDFDNRHYFTSDELIFENISILNLQDQSIFLIKLQLILPWNTTEQVIDDVLEPGGQISLSPLSIKIPLRIKTGYYPFRLLLYYFNLNSSKSDVKRLASPPFQVFIRESILQFSILNLRIPHVLTRGESITINLSIENEGNVAAEEVVLYVKLEGRDLLNFTFPSDSLLPGTRRDINLTLRIPKDVDLGDNFILINLLWPGGGQNISKDVFIAPQRGEIVLPEIKLAHEVFRSANYTYHQALIEGKVTSEALSMYQDLAKLIMVMEEAYEGFRYEEASRNAREAVNLSKRLLTAIYDEYMRPAEKSLKRAQMKLGEAIDIGVPAEKLNRCTELLNRSAGEIGAGYMAYNLTISEVRKHSFTALNLSETAYLEIERIIEEVREIQAKNLVIIYTIIFFTIFVALMIAQHQLIER